MAYARRPRKQGEERRGRKRPGIQPLCAPSQCMDACCQSLCPLTTIDPFGTLNAVRPDGWEELELTVDSGASETVVGENMILSTDVVESAASRRGVKYEVANGVTIPNLGEQRFTVHTEEGIQRNITAQVCDVTKALLSVRKMVDAGNRVVFDKRGSYVEHCQTGERMYMTEKAGMYVIKVWTKSSGF